MVSVPRLFACATARGGAVRAAGAPGRRPAARNEGSVAQPQDGEEVRISTVTVLGDQVVPGVRFDEPPSVEQVVELRERGVRAV